MTSLRIGRTAGGGVSLEVRLHPRSSRAGVTGVREGALEMRVGSPPVDGRANDEARRLLARLLGVAPSKVTLLGGAKSRSKRFGVEGLGREEALDRVEAALKGGVR